MQNNSGNTENSTEQPTLQELEQAPSVDRSEVIGDGVRVVALWCIRILVIAVTFYAGWHVMKPLWGGVLPIILAIIVCTVLWPPTYWLRSKGIPAALAAAISLLTSFGMFGALIWLMAPNIANQSQTLYFQAFEGIQQVQLWLQGPPFNLDPDELSNQINRVAEWFQEQSGAIASEVFSGISMATSVLATLAIVFVLTFFFLKDGDRFLPWLRSVTGRRAGWHLTELLTRAWNTLGGFIRAQALVSLIDAVFIGGGLFILGVPMALALAVLTFIGGFVPIVGAFVSGFIAVLVALVTLGLNKAIITLLIVLAVQQLEGNVLSPLLQSKAMNLHPVIVLISVTVGGGLFGIIGAFLAVPFAATIAVVLRYLQDMIALRSGEATINDITFATDDGSKGARDSERDGERRKAEKQEEAKKRQGGPKALFEQVFSKQNSGANSANSGDTGKQGS
ncbi:pheromone autoinducer 2 transporter [Corynebacterium pelargi]|uniref:Pheromone autoinducer 2 transporter n=1 Tax=Corynebacterium pelargi TaxID=1471400 RepID=A0A410W9R7_9CORY|nr:pheromone autoinducer 2 transporter [Corynebacterium pelargi]